MIKVIIELFRNKDKKEWVFDEEMKSWILE